MTLHTADLCDTHDERVRVVTPMFNNYGGLRSFGGRLATVKVFEDNSLVRSILETPGNGRVLVVDGGGSMRCALLGDQLAELALSNDWVGIIVYGCIRDSRAIGALSLGVVATATHPRKSIKKGVGEVDVPVSFGGVTFVPGEYAYADEDGVIVSAHALI